MSWFKSKEEKRKELLEKMDYFYSHCPFCGSDSIIELNDDGLCECGICGERWNNFRRRFNPYGDRL